MHTAMGLVTRGFLCPSMAQVVQQVALAPDAGQALLVKALELPLPASMTEAKGIHQSDVILRTALVMAIADLRANPWLLDHVFASLLEDAATAQTYGEKERQRAKDWFLRTDVPVVMDYRGEAPEAAMLSISLVDSVETENTLGDVHYETSEDVEAAWPPLTPAFTPEAYSPATGLVRLPAAITAELVPAVGMVLLDRVGRAHAVTATPDRSTVAIAPGTVADFSNAVLKGAQPRFRVGIESLAFRETYRIGVHTHGEAHTLTWLHAVTTFCLLRYKEVLLEARGLERTTVSSSAFAKNEALGPENYWTRYISLTGYVRQSWPKTPQQRVLSVETEINKVSKIGDTTETFVSDPSESEDPAWYAQDGLGMKIE